MFGRIMLGLVIMVAGGALVYYSANLVETFGRSSWAESRLSGGTKQLWVLIGFGMIVIGGLSMFGVVSFKDPTDVDMSGF